MTTRTVIHSARIVTAGCVIEDAWVLFDDGRIAATGQGGVGPAGQGLTPAEVVDARGRYLTPGFIDIHGHGAGGATFGDGAAGIAEALRVHRSHGTTRSVLSLVTAKIDDLEHQLDTIAAVTASNPSVLGSHLEGPFLAVGHKGAHDPALLRAPDPITVQRLIDASRGSLRQITLAPEQPGGIDAVRQLVEAGVTVALGHSDANYEEAREAFAAGATLLTHAFNGMNGIHHRAPGPVVAALRSAHVTLEVINDGVHVDPEIVRLCFDEAPGRVALITDAMAATGSPDGEYMLGRLRVEVRDRVARLVDGNSIAGSTLTLDAALRQAVGAVHLPLETAVAALTEVPARAIGRSGDLGRLSPGYVADAVLLDEGLGVTTVWVAGKRYPAL